MTEQTVDGGLPLHPKPAPAGDRRFLAQINSDGKIAPVLPDPRGVVTRLVNPRLRAFARTPYEKVFTDLATIDAAEAAIAEGCDALYIDSFADYGIEAIRSSCRVPVTGAGEAGIAAAAARGHYSVVTVWPLSMGFLYEERLRTCSGGERCRGVHHISFEDELSRLGTGDGVRARMRRVEPALLDRLADACNAAAEADASNAILLGCTCMSPVAAELAQRCSVPVLDPAHVGLLAAFSTLKTLNHQVPVDVLMPHGRTVGRLVDAWMSFGNEATDHECDVCAFDTSVAGVREEDS